MKIADQIRQNVRPFTTLDVGGAARWFVRAHGAQELAQALTWAKSHQVPVFVLGGGSNVLMADAGFDGLVLQLADHHIEIQHTDDGRCLVHAGAGVVWDELVDFAVTHDLAGLTCLSGIPGCVGAAPIQNIGAYGQDVSETIAQVHAVERATGASRTFEADECGFAYRHSHFKGRWRDQFVITAVTFALSPGQQAPLRYRDLKERFAGQDTAPLKETRQAVLEIRRSKSMVYDTADPNHRCAGSFFVNPIVAEKDAQHVVEVAQERWGQDTPVPQYPAGQGKVKLAAGWLIERSGFEKGHIAGRAGLSSRHCLALINRGGASAAEIVALARTIQAQVQQTFGVQLEPEPTWVGFESQDTA